MMKKVSLRISALMFALLLVCSSMLMVSAATGYLDDTANRFSAEEKAAVYDEMESGYKKTIEQQKEEIETLKAAVEAGGGSVVVELPDDQRSEEDTTVVNRTGVGHNIGQVDNAAADRNNANVRGISNSDIELLIQGE